MNEMAQQEFGGMCGLAHSPLCQMKMPVPFGAQRRIVYIRDATDDQLRAAVHRRGLKIFCTESERGEIGREFMASCDNEALRAECERRGMHFEGAPMSEMRKERESVTKAFQSECRVSAKLGAEVAELQAERDSWRKRAEEAEAKLETKIIDEAYLGPPRTPRESKCKHGHHKSFCVECVASLLKNNSTGAGARPVGVGENSHAPDRYALNIPNRTFTPEEREQIKREYRQVVARQLGVENGLGIATTPHWQKPKPDASVAFLDEDLLCEDA